MYVTDPLTTGRFANQDVTGVVFGNGPSLDGLRNEFFRRCDAAKDWLTVGTNRFALVDRVRRAYFFPDLYFTWDCPNRKDNVLAEDMHHCMQRVKGISWRVAVVRPNDHARFDADQYLTSADSYGSSLADGCRSIATVVDGAVDMLYRAGVRKVYLYGVDHSGGYATMRTLAPCETWMQCEAAKMSLAREWRAVRAARPDLEIWCANKDSLLVREMAVPYGEL